MIFKPEPLQYNRYYYVSSKGNNGIKVFMECENYRYFLRLAEKYVSPISDIISYCLLPNEIHFLLYIKSEDAIEPWRFTYTTVEIPTVYHPTKQISHFLNAYTQAINKKYGRSGNLFQKVFCRNEITDIDTMKRLTINLHHQPAIKFVEKEWKIYPWSSFSNFRYGYMEIFERHLGISDEFEKNRFLNMHNMQ